QFTQILTHKCRADVLREVVPPHVLTDRDGDVQHGILDLRIPVVNLEMQLLIQAGGPTRTHEPSFAANGDKLVEDHEPSRKDDIVPVTLAIDDDDIVAGKAYRGQIQPVMDVWNGRVDGELVFRDGDLIIYCHILQGGQVGRCPVAITVHNTGVIALHRLVYVVKFQYQVALAQRDHSRQKLVFPGSKSGV